jgi:hypothetical protein
MPFSNRLFCRFPVQGAFTYNAGPFFLQAAAGLLFGFRVTHMDCSVGPTPRLTVSRGTPSLAAQWVVRFRERKFTTRGRTTYGG